MASEQKWTNEPEFEAINKLNSLDLENLMFIWPCIIVIFEE